MRILSFTVFVAKKIERRHGGDGTELPGSGWLVFGGAGARWWQESVGGRA